MSSLRSPLSTKQRITNRRRPKRLISSVHITRDGSRMQRLIKVATFFPASTRVAGARMRIYEKAYDVNPSLKSEAAHHSLPKPSPTSSGRAISRTPKS